MDGISVANTMFVEFHETNPSRISQCWSRELVLLVASGARSTISANSEMCACFFQQAKIFFFASCSCHPFFLSFFLSFSVFFCHCVFFSSPYFSFSHVSSKTSSKILFSSSCHRWSCPTQTGRKTPIHRNPSCRSSCRPRRSRECRWMDRLRRLSPPYPRSYNSCTGTTDAPPVRISCRLLVQACLNSR